MIDQDVTSNIQQQLMPHIQWARVGHCIFKNEKFDHKPHKMGKQYQLSTAL